MADDLPKDDTSEKPSEAERLTILGGKVTMYAAWLQIGGGFVTAFLGGILLFHYTQLFNPKDSSPQPSPAPVEKVEKKLQDDVPKTAEPTVAPTSSPTVAATPSPNETPAISVTPYNSPDKSWRDALKNNPSKLYGYENLQKQRSIFDGIKMQPDKPRTFYEHAKEDIYSVGVGIYKYYRKLPGILRFLIFWGMVRGIVRCIIGFIKGE